MKQYNDIAKNPQDGLWYVIGYCGRSRITGCQQWMPVSSGYINKDDAIAYMKQLPLAERAARAELYTI